MSQKSSEAISSRETPNTICKIRLTKTSFAISWLLRFNHIIEIWLWLHEQQSQRPCCSCGCWLCRISLHRNTRRRLSHEDKVESYHEYAARGRGTSGLYCPCKWRGAQGLWWCVCSPWQQPMPSGGHWTYLFTYLFYISMTQAATSVPLTAMPMPVPLLLPSCHSTTGSRVLRALPWTSNNMPNDENNQNWYETIAIR